MQIIYRTLVVQCIVNSREVERHGGNVRKRALAGVHEAFAASVWGELKLLCGCAVCCTAKVQFLLVHEDLGAPLNNKNGRHVKTGTHRTLHSITAVLKLEQ
jgi:hypothetical protein